MGRHELCPRVYIGNFPEGIKLCSDLGRVLILNDPPAWFCSPGTRARPLWRRTPRQQRRASRRTPMARSSRRYLCDRRRGGMPRRRRPWRRLWRRATATCWWGQCYTCGSVSLCGSRYHSLSLCGSLCVSCSVSLPLSHPYTQGEKGESLMPPGTHGGVYPFLSLSILIEMLSSPASCDTASIVYLVSMCWSCQCPTRRAGSGQSGAGRTLESRSGVGSHLGRGARRKLWGMR